MARLIDADALLRNTVYNTLNAPYITKRDVEEAPTVGGWISVKDRIPERQMPVIVYVPPHKDDEEEYFGHVGMAYYTYSGNGGYWAGTDGAVYGAIGIIHKPTHWMPLPEPPKEGER